MQVIEILGRDNVQMSPKQVKQIIDLIGKFLLKSHLSSYGIDCDGDLFL